MTKFRTSLAFLLTTAFVAGVGGTVLAGVVQSDLDVADRAVPPIGLEAVDVPGLDHALEIAGMAPLGETLRKEVVGDADHLTEETPWIGMRDQFFDFDAIDVARDVVGIGHGNS